MAKKRACIWVLAGTNGAGKSSIGGAMLRQSGGEYFNPDEAALRLRAARPSLTQTQANALAWNIGLRQLDRAIAQGHDYFFETTLGGKTICTRLAWALDAGLEVRIWYVGLCDPQLHVQRVAQRVKAGGHNIPESAIHHRFDSSRRNLIALLPRLAELKIYDNTKQASPQEGQAPSPQLVLHMRNGRIIAPTNLRRTPLWAKPIVAKALLHTRS